MSTRATDPQTNTLHLNLPKGCTAKLSEAAIVANLSEMHEPLNNVQAVIEADRCFFCYDAPCTIACPTEIDIPEFIRRIKTGNRVGSAQKILQQNIMGAMCSRVCPTEQLCEEACVRNTQESKPVEIGLLQRFATDAVIEPKIQFETRQPETGKRIAIIGAGPAGLSCAHGLAKRGHNVTIYEKNSKPGGLNEYGIASYKALNNIAQKDVEYILEIGGIEILYNQALGKEVSLDNLTEDFDAVFLGAGLGDVNALGLTNEDSLGVTDAVDYIEALRQSEDMSSLPVGDSVVVIGGGMTAVDIAVQSQKLGAREVTIVYRRDRSQMGASEHEQHYAAQNGVRLTFLASPEELLTEAGEVKGLKLRRNNIAADGSLQPTDEYFTIEADVVFKAIGQKLQINDLGESAGLLCDGKNRIHVDDNRKTNHPKIWAGGDCVADGEDLTVAAVQDGKIAAQAIDAELSAV